jgi:adenylate cyclase
VQALAAHGAAAIVFDLQFSEPDRWSPEGYVKALPAGQAQSSAGAIDKSPTNDEIFATSLQQTPSVIAVALNNNRQPSAPATQPDAAALANCLMVPFGKAGFTWAGNCPELFIPNFSNSSVLPLLAQAAPGDGAVTYVPDADNIVRRIGLIFRQDNRLVPSLAAEAIRVARGERSYVIEVSNGSGEAAFGEETGINHFDIGDLHVPTDESGAITLKYRRTNPGAFISAAAVLDNKVPEEDISGRIIIIGTTAAGQVDLHPTPVDAAAPGVEIQAQVVENILGDTELVRPDYILAVEELIILAIVAMLAVVMPRVSSRWLAVISVFVLIAVVGGGWAAYDYASLLIDPVYPTITLVVFITVITFHTYRHSEAQRSLIRRAYHAAGHDND